MKKGWFILGLAAILIGLILFSFYNTFVYVDNHHVRGMSSLKVEVSGYFDSGERFFFNFSRGRYWTGAEELFEPSETWEDFYIPPHKKVAFHVITPSNDVCEVEAWVVKGETPYVIIYRNQSSDFTPLPNGNLTFTGAGIEGIINRSGIYTIKAVSIVPPITKTIQEPALGIEDDPPRTMALWKIETVQTQPYSVFLPIGVASACIGAIVIVHSARDKRKRRLPLRKYRR